MDSFNYDDNSMETQEASGIARDNRLRSMGKAFRTIDLCIALFFLLGVILRLPFAVRIFGELVRRLVLVLLTPLVISLLFGICVAILMVQSYRLSTQNITEDNVGNNFYENMVDVGELHTTVASQRCRQKVEVLPYEVEGKHVKMKNIAPLYEEVVYEDKEIVMSYDSHKPKIPFSVTCDIPGEGETYTDSDMGNELDVDVDIKNQSKKEQEEESIMEDDVDDVVLENQYSSPRDLLNDADFKKIIDAFIKKQRDFLKLENRCDYHGKSHVYCY